jgi:hypothetical protein
MSYYCDECRSRATEKYKNRYIPPRFVMKAFHPSAQGDFGQGPGHKLYDNEKKEYVNLNELAKVI